VFNHARGGDDGDGKKRKIEQRKLKGKKVEVGGISTYRKTADFLRGGQHNSQSQGGKKTHEGTRAVSIFCKKNPAFSGREGEKGFGRRGGR